VCIMVIGLLHVNRVVGLLRQGRVVVRPSRPDTEIDTLSLNDRADP
jgi:hypothetical protein